MKQRGSESFFLGVVVPLLSIIAMLGLFKTNGELENEVDRLEQELSETRQQLLISNDTLKQINMYHEREFYMEDLEGEGLND